MQREVPSTGDSGSVVGAKALSRSERSKCDKDPTYVSSTESQVAIVGDNLARRR